MINSPFVLSEQSFQLAWLKATLELDSHGWQMRNLIVHIADPLSFDNKFHEEFSRFCIDNLLLGPKDVAYTIFPHKLYRKKVSIDGVFQSYNRHGGLYERLRSRPRSGWGTYFRRMTHYEKQDGVENQLMNIIQAIRSRPNTYKAAYTIIIQKPGGETIRPLGGPCLNYLAVQMEPAYPNPIIGLLAVYRNHDFLQRAYGNYWGLCNLICCLANETNCDPGPLTCVSSRAYVDSRKNVLSDFLRAH